MRRQVLALSIVFALPLGAFAQMNDAVRLTETFAKDTQYNVQCQVEIAGSLSIPGEGKDAKPRMLTVAGKSSIKYDERILRVAPGGQVERTVRFYRQLEFDRKVGEETQRSRLRGEASRLVILRHNQYEVPFCPHGPLLWNELELVRTDVFAPALRGLLPDKQVRVGERWNADPVAIQELTDLEKIDKAELTCTFEKITTLLGRRNAHVQFEGKAQGVGEDGNALHELRGSYYVDIDASFITYLYVKGTHHLLDKTGAPTGKIDGTFIMTRTPTPETKEVGDDALRGLVLEPNPDNALLLFDHPQVGARFLYPRNWRVAGFNDKQIGVDENQGSGVLITLSPAAQTPSGAQFQQETAQFLAKQQAKILRQEPPRALGNGWESFRFDADIGKERLILQYFTARQGNLGVTLTARILPQHAASVQADLERIAKSVQLRTPK
ncbi:MAG: hypothetical protein FJ303_22970 [Planctomycetes bacterium]|nr:hypothetical protein [Planctomycetota bacterium]